MNRNEPDQKSQNNLELHYFAGEPDSDDYSDDYDLDETKIDLEQGIINFFEEFVLRDEKNETTSNKRTTSKRNSW